MCSKVLHSCELHVRAVLRLLASLHLARSLGASQVLAGAIKVLLGLFCGGLTALPPNSPLVHGIKWSCGNGTEEFSVEQLVQQILDTHPTKPAPRTHACLCSGGLG